MTQTLKLTFRDLDKQVCSLNWARRLVRSVSVRTLIFIGYMTKRTINGRFLGLDYFDEDEKHFAAFTAQDFVDLFPRLFKFARNDNEEFLLEAIDVTWRMKKAG